MCKSPTPIKNMLYARARLGEGPIWDHQQQRLFWVDIYNHRLHKFDLATQQDTFWEFEDLVTGLALIDAENLVLAQRDGLSRLHLPTQRLTFLIDLESDQPDNRLNDLKCDRRGRLWLGSMNNHEEPKAKLYRYDPDGSLRVMETELSISNGLGWSPDDTTFYLTDSPAQKIYAYDFDLDSGQIHNRRVLIDLTTESFYPDGLTIDAEGCIWSAMWDGWCVIRFNPEGQELMRIPMPIQRPTSCTFGGPDLTDLWITTAAVGLSQSEIQKGFYAGDLFCLQTDIVGSPNHAFNLSD
ncbi:MAG: SMP-30/gluconolactonase/LRE family protein [Cyanobacteria bacterium P01_D01_bin.56]